jgi:hypothetical protein
MWREQAFEVVSRAAHGQGDRWGLRPWPTSEAMRTVVTLDAELVLGLALGAAAEQRARAARRATLLLLPVMGLAPARLQRRWRDEWGFDAGLATRLSALAEIAVGILGIVQLAAAVVGAGWFLPAPLAAVGPVLALSGGFRLALNFADEEPHGSPLGLPLQLFDRGSASRRDASVPVVQQLDEANGVLVLRCADMRRDWEVGGVLSYRGRPFRLVSVDRAGSGWTYRFRSPEDATGAEATLRLAAPTEAPHRPRHEGSKPPPFFKTVFVSAAVTLGPSADQEAWGRHLQMNPTWLTVVGALAELVGGLVNLGSGGGESSQPIVLLNLYLVAEGLVRLGSLLAGRLMGSVFGWVLRPLYRRWLPR